MLKLPAAFITKYQHLLGDRAESFLASFQSEPVAAFRLNPLKNLQDYGDLSKKHPVSWNPENGRYGKISGQSDAFLTGVVYSQEASAQFVARVVDAAANECVLDLAAAPGGKTTQMAADMQNQGLLVANEINFGRAKILSQNIERMGINNCLVTCEKPNALADLFPNYFDKILLDAPCTGEGMFRKDPNAIDYWHPDYNDECAHRQKEILKSALLMLKPGGQLIYSTCTFAPEEDEQVIAWLLSEYPDLQLLPINKPEGIEDGRPNWADNNPELKKTARLWPDKLQGEGHFVAKLVKAADEPTDSQTKLLKSNLNKKDLPVIRTFFKESHLSFPLDRLFEFADYVYLFPEDCPSIKGLRVLRLGLQLGQLKKNRFVPSQSLAMSLIPADSAEINRFELSDDQLKAYVHGDVIANLTVPLQKGWVLVTKKNNGLAFGRYSDHMIKNFYPKGLRTTLHD
ncbi:RsmF rRNA methyltransferase first C-terminal domain-containing protein [Oenococcus kitaharae]|uniref:RsmF rRNA methyltransferase first C-terminal domain-containing protein n=2 Tax=Lactobacillaceae TaxID=33958 RepID=UPI0021E78777|nr:RsmF rRNA methyltransferase first C-terminal domain-containing protein [Oenococcus kitaharae]MCV3295887.1 RsmF rRNA methyltransferase first C-terminal domain-containing protein [Oenococcus kitaharae]